MSVWAGAKSAERCIFCQDMSFGSRGPHDVSKGLVVVGAHPLVKFLLLCCHFHTAI
jgi:hypothetical protein